VASSNPASGRAVGRVWRIRRPSVQWRSLQIRGERVRSRPVSPPPPPPEDAAAARGAGCCCCWMPAATRRDETRVCFCSDGCDAGCDAMGGPRADTHTNDNTTPSLERRSRGAPLFIYLFLFYFIIITDALLPRVIHPSIDH
jgi:hypothetical protein